MRPTEAALADSFLESSLTPDSETRMIGGVRHFLLQAKNEPGNLNGLQLAPTGQATRSEYTRVHGGSRAAYHE